MCEWCLCPIIIMRGYSIYYKYEEVSKWDVWDKLQVWWGGEISCVSMKRHGMVDFTLHVLGIKYDVCMCVCPICEVISHIISTKSWINGVFAG